MNFNQILDDCDRVSQIINSSTPEIAAEKLKAWNTNHESLVQVLRPVAEAHLATRLTFVPPQVTPLKKNLRYFLDYDCLDPVVETDDMDDIYIVCMYLFYQGAYCVSSEIFMTAMQIIPDICKYRSVHAMIFRVYVDQFKDKEQNLSMLYEMMKG